MVARGYRGRAAREGTMRNRMKGNEGRDINVQWGERVATVYDGKCSDARTDGVSSKIVCVRCLLDPQ